MSDTVDRKGFKQLTSHAFNNPYGKEILESTSYQFLDLTVRLRLQKISESEVVKLLTEAGRLSYQKTDTILGETGARSAPRSKPDAIATPKPPVAIAGQYHPISTASSQPPSLGESRAPKHTNTVQVRRDESLSTTHISILLMPTRLLLLRKKVAITFRTYGEWWVCEVGCQQLPGWAGNGDKGMLKNRIWTPSHSSCYQV